MEVSKKASEVCSLHARCSMIPGNLDDGGPVLEGFLFRLPALLYSRHWDTNTTILVGSHDTATMSPIEPASVVCLSHWALASVQPLKPP